MNATAFSTTRMTISTSFPSAVPSDRCARDAPACWPSGHSDRRLRASSVHRCYIGRLGLGWPFPRALPRPEDPLSATQAGPDFRPLTAVNRPPPKTAFDRVLHELLDDLFETQPDFATRVGFHGYDDRWPDPSECG